MDANTKVNKICFRISAFCCTSNIARFDIVEFQKRGAVHYHAVLFNIPFIENIKDKWADIWGHGFINIKSIHNINSIGAYLSLNQRRGLFLSLDHVGRERITTRSVQRWIKEIAQNAGIKERIHPHMFRHAKAHSMKARGADLKDIQLMLGHISPYSALMYLNFDKNEMLDNARRYL